MKIWRVGTFVIVFLFLLFGCQSKEDKILLEKLKARESAKIQLLQKPANYIIPGEWDSFDKGIINSYTKATAIKFNYQSQSRTLQIAGSFDVVNFLHHRMIKRG